MLEAWRTRRYTVYIPYTDRIYAYIYRIYILYTRYIRYRFNLHTVYLCSATSLQMEAPDKFLFKKYNGITNGPGFFVYFVVL